MIEYSKYKIFKVRHLPKIDINKEGVCTKITLKYLTNVDDTYSLVGRSADLFTGSLQYFMMTSSGNDSMHIPIPQLSYVTIGSLSTGSTKKLRYTYQEGGTEYVIDEYLNKGLILVMTPEMENYPDWVDSSEDLTGKEEYFDINLKKFYM